MNEQQLIKLLESAEGTIARLMLEVNRLSKELDRCKGLRDKEVYLADYVKNAKLRLDAGEE
jgi:hypothetical protein